ncbi:MAG: ABC transporter permease [Acidobacteriia bacterium]|nr:ABC transporter permease [Terriglobia bacterium]
MTRANVIYRALLYCYPAAFRQEYGNQMLFMFSEQLEHARRAQGRTGAASIWFRAALDALTVAPKEHFHVILQDLRYAFRTMAASPSFTAVAILSLALGIGANTAIFSLWNGVIHASLPGVDKPEQLVMLSDPDRQGMWTGNLTTREDGDRPWLTYAEFEQFRDSSGVFSAVMATQSDFDTLQVRVGGGEFERANSHLVSGGFFQVLGVSPVLGHAFTAADDFGDAPYAVISYDYWQRRFGGRTDVLGKTLAMRKGALTIIGVAPRGFFGETSGQQPDLWIPLRMQPLVLPGDDRLHDEGIEKVMWLQVFGRLKPGVTLAQAEAQVNSLFRAGLEAFYSGVLTAEKRAGYLDQRIRIRPAARGASSVRKRFSGSLSAMLAAVGVLLLIACANLANLLLARGAARRPEIALRLSLGASRGRIMRQMITESLALAVMGGLAGLATAYVLHGALVRLLNFQMNFSLDPMVVAFTAAATLGAALLFGVLPAWQVTTIDAGQPLHEQSRSATASIGRTQWGRLLVSLQIALSLPLLVGAGLLARTLYNLQRTDLGYPAERLLLVRIDPREAGYNSVRRDTLMRELLEQFQRIPGVRAASFSSLGVFSGGNTILGVEVEGYTPKGDKDRSSDFDAVGPGYFAALGAPIVRGRDILESDRHGAPNVCVVNEAFAKQFFEGRNPIGRSVTSAEEHERMTCQVVGVAKNARTQKLRRDAKPRCYLAAMQSPSDAESPTILIRTATGPAPVLAAVRQTIQRTYSSLPILSVKSIEEQVARLTAQDRAVAQIALAFAAVALTLAAIGLYGVLSYGIARRRSEIAIRIALGAQSARVIAMVLRETTRMVIAGLALGAGLAYAASRVVTSQLFGVSPQDPLTLALAIGILVAVALCAAYFPAQRASKLDPMVALRSE